MPTNPLSRRATPWPFAKNSDQDSIGEYLGILYPSRLLGGIHHWKAKGEASRWFEDSIKPTILDFIGKNCEKVHESNDILLILICMVGKKAEQTKPVIFLVSDDKPARKQAFDIVKGSKIMESFPGFELGHTDSGAVRLLSDEVAAVSYEIKFTEDGEVLQLFRQPEKRGDMGRVATAGGIITHCGRYMLLTVDHFLEDAPQEPTGPSPGSIQEGEDLDECEITGLDDFGDNNDEIDEIEVTSRGSQSDFEGLNSDTDIEESSDSNQVSASPDTDSLNAIKITARPPSPASVSTSVPDFARNQTNNVLQPRDTGLATEVQNLVGLGSTVAQDRKLDYNLIEIDPASFAYIPKRLFQEAVPFSQDTCIERAPREATVWTLTASGGKVEGTLSGSAHHIRLPNSKSFMQVYMANFSQPLVYGDCGAWVRDTATGRLYGHVIAGSLISGQVVIVPARDTLKHARSLNKPRDSAQLFNTPREFPQMVLKRRISEIESNLQNWADPNTVVDNMGTTAFHYAAFCNDIELLSLLKLYGATIDSKKQTGRSILFMTICTERRLLQSQPVEFVGNLRRFPTIDKTDETVLEALKVIFLGPSVWEDLGASVDEPDPGGVTPLMAAAENGFEKTIAYLLGLGANPKKTDTSGLTAYAHALKARRTGTARLLRDAVARWPAENQEKRTGTTKISSLAEREKQKPPHTSILHDHDVLWCEFERFGGCKPTFRLIDGEAWINHHIDHLRHSLLHPPVFPDRLSCWFCGCPFVTGSVGDEESQQRTFGRRMKHIYLHIADAYIVDHKSIKDQSQPDELMAKHMTEMDLVNRPNPPVRAMEQGGHGIEHQFLDKDEELFLEQFFPNEPTLIQHNNDSGMKFTPDKRMDGEIGGRFGPSAINSFEDALRAENEEVAALLRAKIDLQSLHGGKSAGTT